MKRGSFRLLVTVLLAAGMGEATLPSAGAAELLNTAQTPKTKGEILAVMEKMADAQLAVPAYRDRSPVDWVAGAFYVGLARLSHVSAKGEHYRQEMLRIAYANNWEFKTDRAAPSIGHGDNNTVGQMYIDLAVGMKDVSKLERIKAQFEQILAEYENPTPEARRGWRNEEPRDKQTLPWWWCDALFMVPPTLAQLSAATGDKKYIDMMDKQWWITTEKLYDKEEHLFFRDASFFDRRTANGKKVYWSRGNGWVFAGTANVLMYMPRDYPARAKYEQLFKEMAGKLIEVQQPDGLWRGSLIDPAASPWAETSGTAFFTYGLAWGVNNGLLEAGKYRPHVEKGWAGLNQRIRGDGLLGFVQAIGDRPAESTEANVQAYATGAFMLAGCEMIKLNEKP
jgi:rhamnogalacturonyl hydrolase YesR